MEEILNKAKKVGKRNKHVETGIESCWMSIYGQIYGKSLEDHEFGLTR